MSGSRFARAGFTLIELLVSVMIFAILTVMTTITWRRRLEQGRADFATTQLILVWHAEKRFFAYEGSYTNDWQALGMNDPTGVEDRFFVYTISSEPGDFIAQARERGASTCLQVDKTGAVVSC